LGAWKRLTGRRHPPIGARSGRRGEGPRPRTGGCWPRSGWAVIWIACFARRTRCRRSGPGDLSSRDPHVAPAAVRAGGRRAGVSMRALRNVWYDTAGSPARRYGVSQAGTFL